MIHAFEDCELDDELFQLRRRGRPVKIEPKPFDVLAYLLRQRHRVVSKDELLDAVWEGVSVSESVLPKCVAAARRAVGDGRADARVIQTVHGRGYRFIAAVEVRPAVEGAAVVPPEAPTAPGADEIHPTFIGRADILARLRMALDSACAGRGRLVLLTGEPGIGKTRTAEELASDARARGASVVIGRAYDGEGAPAFWPWVQILRGCARDPTLRAHLAARDFDVSELVALVPELQSRPASAARTRASADAASSPRGRRASSETLAPDREHARFRLFDAVVTFLKAAAARQPMVVLLDDVQWADEASLRLLRLVAGALTDARLLVVATCRDEEFPPGHPMADFRGALARERDCEWIALGGLQPTETAAVLAAVTGGPVAAEVASAVHAMTEGNPFFVHETAQLLRAHGTLPGAEAHTLSLPLPQRVRDAIRRRLAMLSPACADLLRVAAVLGGELDVPLLARVGDVSATRALELVAEARAARVLDDTKDADGRYAFHHVLFRQTLYDDLAPAARIRLHGRAGESLEDIHGTDLDACADELARHFFAAAPAGDSARAVTSCVRAGELAYDLLAYEQSAGHYARALQALDLAPRADETRRAELLVALGVARSASGARGPAQEAFARAAALARHAERADLLARAALGYRTPSEMGSPAEPSVVALLEEAMGALAGTHPALRARLLSRLIGTPPYSHSMETRERLSSEALALAGREDDAETLRDALAARLWACAGPDRIDDRLTVARELLALAERAGDKHVALLGYDAALGAHLLRGELEAADRALAAYGRLAAELRQPAFIFRAMVWQGSRAMARGELAVAERFFRSAFERGRGTVPYAHFMFAGQMYPLVYLRGDDDDPELSRIFFGEMMDLPYSWDTAIRAALAFSLLLRGQPEAARREFDALAERGFATIRRDEHWLVTLAGLSNLAVLLGDRTQAAQLYDLLLPFEDLIVVHDLLRSIGGTVAATLGHLATLLERYDEAGAHYEHAVAKETAIGTIVALLESQAGYARLLERRNRSGDRKRAESLRANVRRRMETLAIRRNWLLDAST